MNQKQEINYVISIIGLGLTLGSLTSVLDFPVLLIFGVGLGTALGGILRATTQLANKLNERNAEHSKPETQNKVAFAIR
ncbi:MAG: hypothetical protein JW806_05665 [Sedimentisphaerales bacterium]|nr:hypothetical protein [Sedimentisphaerales bacterium]